MGDWINFNGSFYAETEAIIPAGNRGLRYGDGVFETMRITPAGIQLEGYHFERLFNGVSLLQIKLPKLVDVKFLKDQIFKTIAKNNISGTVRVRLMIFRGSGGVFEMGAPANFLIECWALSPVRSKLNENGLVIGIYEGARKACDEIANLKSNNYLVYILAALNAKENKHNDSLVMNTNNRICESSISNLFWVKEERIFTPPLSEGCVAGVMRRNLLERLPAAGFSITEKPAEKEDLLRADELFLTNAIGIRWVSTLNDKLFDNKMISRIYHSTIFSK